jgi:plasmid maintenance system antidote protein VapI
MKRQTPAPEQNTGPNPLLLRYVQQLVENRYGTMSRLAEAIDMSLSAFSRAIKEEGSLSSENCIRLAHEVGEHPAVILRLSNRDDFAAIVEDLYPRKEAFSATERALVYLWRTLDYDHAQNQLRTIQFLSAAAKSDAAKSDAVVKRRRRIPLKPKP